MHYFVCNVVFQFSQFFFFLWAATPVFIAEILYLRVLDMSHCLILQAKDKPRRAFAIVKERIVTTQPCSVIEEVQQGGQCGGGLSLWGPTKPKVRYQDLRLCYPATYIAIRLLPRGIFLSNQCQPAQICRFSWRTMQVYWRTVTLPWKFPSTLPLPLPSPSSRSDTTDTLVRAIRSVFYFSKKSLFMQHASLSAELCLMSDTKGGFEVDGPPQTKVVGVTGAPANNHLRQGKGLFVLSCPGVCSRGSDSHHQLFIHLFFSFL